MNFRHLILSYPNALYISLSALGCLFGLTMSSSFIPLTFTVAMLLLYAPVLFNRPHRYMYTALLWASLSLSSSLGRLVPTLNALSTAGPSVAVLLGMSSFTSALAILAIFADVAICARIHTSQALFFPAIWTTLWAATSHLPLGRLTSWTPVVGTDSYSWMAPLVSYAGIDWVVAAWAVVISQVIGSWYMGDSEDGILTTEDTGHVSNSSKTGILAIFLVALTIPSFIISGTPIPVHPHTTFTAFGVGCALPPFSRYKDTSPTLHDYIEESKKLSDAKVILWPEGAVSFHNTSDRDAAFKHIQHSIGGGHIGGSIHWAISFNEDSTDPSDDSGSTSLSRTGVAILSNSSANVVYYKRNLVPIAESFHLAPGSSPPPLYTLPLDPPKGIKRGQWAPGPDYTRPILLSASICLDFAMPSPFRNLNSRPAVILAPARTWDPAIGSRMWEEVKQRANEIGSLALWCDGGKGGVSGVAGGGYNEVYQVGEGSWSRSVGIPYPFDSTRTFYARFGDAFVLAASWLSVTGSIGILTLSQYKSRRNVRVDRPIQADDSERLIDI
ncbi:hypothetical protein C8R43DRAFT_1063407 [Mycena crocata]|nr:hypothetical protein C8R43DRAFT_1063407 [Mycena crocata]